MGGVYDEALPLLHRKLVIHEKYGPEESVGDTLQQLGTAYRLYSNHTLAIQHLEKARACREKLEETKPSHKVAETLNSLALVYHSQGNAALAEDFHSRSLQCYYLCTDTEDSQSEDIPWEVFKRVQSDKGPSTAQNSMTLLKGNIRMAIQQAIVQQQVEQVDKTPNEVVSTPPSTTRRLYRSLSDGAMPLRDAEDFKQVVSSSKSKRILKKNLSTIEPPPRRNIDMDIDFSPVVDEVTHEPIRSFPVLLERVEALKRRAASGSIQF
ncbi:unnamed protein product [Aphanomyces euteiches]